MRASQLFIGIDSGTQGTKAVVLDRESGIILAEAYAPHELLEDAHGKREQDPAWWLEACETVLSKVLAAPEVDPARVRGIGVSGQQHGMVPLDAAGAVIRPAKLWCDTATADQCETITDRLGGPARTVTILGNSVAAGFTASKILWMKENEPANFERLATVLLPHDYINFWLTGERKAEFGDASGTAYFNVRTRGWSDEALQAIDDSGKLADCLPELIDSRDPVGVVRPELARKLGLPGDVLVSSGGGDNMMGAIGTGNVAPGVVTTSLGTSGTIYAYSDSPIIDQRGELAAFCSSTGGWLPLVCTMNVTVATEQAKTILSLDTAQVNKLAESASAGAGGITMIPFLNGERTPALPTATASALGLTTSNLTPANICRASMEGATFGLRYGLEVFKRLGLRPGQVRLIGGGAKSKLWRSMVADIFQCEVVRPTIGEAGALGGAIQALWCLLCQKDRKASIKDLTDRYVTLNVEETVEPDPERLKEYERLFRHYLRLEAALRPTY